jgi:HAE1 family hydrophobic/amphiphilic exporter-1
VELDRDRAASFGLDVREVAHAVSAAVQGLAATELSAFGRTVPVVVQLPDARRRSLDALRALDVRGVPLRELARVREVRAPTEVRREAQARVASVLADVTGRGRASTSLALQAVERAVDESPRPDGASVEIAGRHVEVRRGLRALGLAFVLAFTLAFLILAAEFESLVQPLTVLLSVPLALIGAVLALWITGTPLSTVSLVGVVVLVGIVDNDAVVKVDCIIRLRARGVDARAAVLEAGRTRLRPIVINTVTAALGLLPMALGWGAGAELQAPLAITVLGGLLSATALTLVVVPVVYTLLDDARAALARAWARSRVP